MPTNNRIVNFFNPADPFASVRPSNWEVQSNSPSISIQRAQGLASNGDESASQVYGNREAITTEYAVHDANGTISLAAFAPGSVDSATGTHCDGVTVTYAPTAWPKISVSGHNHTHCESGITSHGSPHRVAKGLLSSLPAGFGCPAALAAIVGVSDLAVGISSFVYSCSVTHQDENGGTGGYLASDNRDGVETITVSFTGVPSTTPAISGWDMTADSTPTGNTAAETSTYTFERHVPTEVDSEQSSES